MNYFFDNLSLFLPFVFLFLIVLFMIIIYDYFIKKKYRKMFSEINFSFDIKSNNISKENNHFMFLLSHKNEKYKDYNFWLLVSKKRNKLVYKINVDSFTTNKRVDVYFKLKLDLFNLIDFNKFENKILKFKLKKEDFFHKLFDLNFNLKNKTDGNFEIIDLKDNDFKIEKNVYFEGEYVYSIGYTLLKYSGYNRIVKFVNLKFLDYNVRSSEDVKCLPSHHYFTFRYPYKYINFVNEFIYHLENDKGLRLKVLINNDLNKIKKSFYEFEENN